MMKVLDLSGNWSYRTDYDDSGTDKGYYKDIFEPGCFMLPGSTCENGIGKKQEYYNELTKESVRAPREKYEYIAPVWLQRKIVVPEEFEGKCIKLFLERVNIASELWIDGEKAGRQIVELSVPHIYDLTDKLTPGTHILTLRIDNRDLLNLNAMASGYSIDTQGYWNGIIGRMELQAENIFHIECIQVYPGADGINVKVTETSDVRSPFVHKRAAIEMWITSPDGKTSEIKRFDISLYNSKQVDYMWYDMEDIQYWDEFHPALYILNIRYICGNVQDEKSVAFGMRTIESRNRQILLNNRQISLRGTTNCAIYPLTGYPPMDIDIWRKHFKIIQSYGFNHVRFHAWCPPEAAFLAADEAGLYLSVEMPMWLNRDVCVMELGEDTIHRQYFMNEALAISKTYGNHPSFIMFSNGNENMGDFDLLNDITVCIKSYDSRRLYTLTTNFDHPVLPCEDYLCAYEAGSHKVRMQDMQDTAAGSTCLDYSGAVKESPVPVISFEIGQYCVYPDVRNIEKYTGNILPANFDVIRKAMEKKNIIHKLDDYVKASGDLAVKLYKEEIEAALRTEDFGGFEILSLCDYTGQSTATVGILDVFFDSKGFVGPEKFMQFCNNVVPLFKAKRIFKNTETLEAELDLYDFGQHKIANPEYDVKIYNGAELFFTCKTTDTNISVELNGIKKSSMLHVSVSVQEYKNEWRIFVFAPSENNKEVRYIRTQDELKRIMKTGGRGVVTRDCFAGLPDGSFIPVFWSPVHFPSQKPCGAIIDAFHPVFENFPTEKYPDYQWKELLDHSKNVDISLFGSNFKPIVEIVPNFMDNTPSSPLFEARIGNADILFCGFDLDQDDITAKQLKTSICHYVNSDLFRPQNAINKIV